MNILLALCFACVLLPAYAVADEGEGAPADEPESSTAVAEPSKSLFEIVRDAIAPISAISDEALFQRQYDWVAVENVNFDSANEDGSLSEWQQDWFISHDWSDYGAVIANLEPGDAVTVNGQTILILGRDEWPNDTINWDVYDAVGWDKTIFQTCLGDYAIWIAYGIPVHPTPEFLASRAA